MPNQDSFFRPYYDVLPTSCPSIPLFWNKEELQWLNGSYGSYIVDIRMNHLKKEYDFICEIAQYSKVLRLINTCSLDR